ncbi:hypothetical protein [Parachryseolinea silvisoli]|jgi:hypothetical protein|uniref:hypothetical protein n=1 Tax=Parachryseolinea silvisoli TaxID=2873601 RepID=UPI002265E46E|nr:hypothetical protein [Parachryseolinea silvisoli]MCD9017345.1 hypothetical protein [Parachryseolinea silvisoli]
MGVLDWNVTAYTVAGTVQVEELHKQYAEKLGAKYKVKLELKGKNMLQSTLKGVGENRVFIAKNAYHRTMVTPVHTDGMTTFRFDESSVSPWLTVLSRQTGLIGSLAIRIIYGDGKDFYADVTDVLRSSYPVTEQTLNVGISTLWKGQNKTSPLK